MGQATGSMYKLWNRRMIKITKQEQEIKDCLIKLLQDYNGSWNDLKKEKRYKELMKYNKSNKGEK